MNSCALALDKTIWVPNILGVQDEFVYKKIEDTIVRESKDKLKNTCCQGKIQYKKY